MAAELLKQGPGKAGPDLIWSDLLSRGRVRRRSRLFGAGASCFVAEVLVSVSSSTRGQTDMRGLLPSSPRTRAAAGASSPRSHMVLPIR